MWCWWTSTAKAAGRQPRATARKPNSRRPPVTTRQLADIHIAQHLYTADITEGRPTDCGCHHARHHADSCPAGGIDERQTDGRASAANSRADRTERPQTPNGPNGRAIRAVSHCNTGRLAVQNGLRRKPAATKPATACGSAALPTGRDGRLMDGYAKCRERSFQLKQ